MHGTLPNRRAVRFPGRRPICPVRSRNLFLIVQSLSQARVGNVLTHFHRERPDHGRGGFLPSRTLGVVAGINRVLARTRPRRQCRIQISEYCLPVGSANLAGDMVGHPMPGHGNMLAFRKLDAAAVLTARLSPAPSTPAQGEPREAHRMRRHSTDSSVRRGGRW
jgi:hypothetical protein